MKRLIQIFQFNYKQSHATSTRASYEYIRASIRRLKQHSPNHPDVAWYADSLGMVPYRTDATIRTTYSWSEGKWIELPRDRMPNRSETGLVSSVVGPVGEKRPYLP